MTSVETIAPFFKRDPVPSVLFAVAVATGAVVCMCRRQESGVWSKLAGTEEEAAVWTGWTVFSSRAFQNLPGASLKQKEEEEVGLPVGMLQANHDPIGTATFNVDRRSTVTPCTVISCVSITELLTHAALTACVVVRRTLLQQPDPRTTCDDIYRRLAGTATTSSNFPCKCSANLSNELPGNCQNSWDVGSCLIEINRQCLQAMIDETT